MNRILLTLSLMSCLNTWGMDNIIHIDQRYIQCQQSEGIEKAAATVIDYIKIGLKNYTDGPTLPRESENDPLCDIYLDLASQFTLAGAEPEDVLPVWADLARVFLEVAKVTLTTEQQKKEYLIFEEELNTYEEKNYIWYCLYMHAMATLVTHPGDRNSTVNFTSNFDVYQKKLNTYLFEGNPSWLSPLGRIKACQSVGSEYTRNVLSILAQTQHFPEIVSLSCPFDLTDVDLIKAQPNPKYHRHLWFIGFLLAPGCADGLKCYYPHMFHMHDWRHQAEKLHWLLGGMDLFFMTSDEKEIPSPKAYWDFVREGRKIESDRIEMLRDFALSLDSSYETDQDRFSKFLIFHMLHEGSHGLWRFFSYLFLQNKDDALTNDFLNTVTLSILLDENYFLPLLPLSLQKQKNHLEAFKRDFSSYTDEFFKQIDGKINCLIKKYEHNEKSRIFASLEEAFSGFTIVGSSFFCSPYQVSERINLLNNRVLLAKQSVVKDLYRILEKEKQHNPESILVRYRFKGSSFYKGKEMPLYHMEVFDLEDEEAEFNKLMQNGTANELNDMGDDYYYGVGGKKDIPKAIKLYNQAIVKGSALAMNTLGDIYVEIESLRDYQKAIELFKMAIEKGEVSAIVNLACMYHKVQGIEKDIPKAIELYKRAIEKGSAAAMNNLGFIYHDDETVRDDQKAIELFEMAIENGSVFAIVNLASMYKQGEGVKKDIQKAIELYRRAVEKGSAVAMNNLAFIYHCEESMRDYEKAIDLYKMAIANGDTPSLYNLSMLYIKEIGGEKGFREGMKFLDKANKKGERHARKFLNELYENAENPELEIYDISYIIEDAESGNLESQEILDQFYKAYNVN